MHNRMCARTRSAVRWWIGRTFRSIVLSERKARSTLAFFFNDTATTEIYTLSLHDALPIRVGTGRSESSAPGWRWALANQAGDACGRLRSEEHTSELQSRLHLVCSLLL